MITSSANQQIKYITHLQKNSKFRKEEGVFVVEGIKMVEESIRHGLALKLFMDENYEGTIQKGIDVEVISHKVFMTMSDTVSPQGIMATVKMPSYELAQLLDAPDSSVLILEDINDPGNLGTMMRTAEGAGMSGVILSKKTVDLFNPKVVRATMGALYRVPFYYTEDLCSVLKTMREMGFSLFAAHLKGQCPYDQESFDGKTGILIGNEANGLSDEVSDLADKKVKIPMEGQLESLNAAVSAAILMYEQNRQKRVKGIANKKENG